MTVLLTGASGFIGRHVLDDLQARGAKVVAVGRRRPTGLAAADFIETDLLSEADLPALVRAADAERLIHLAWYAEHGAYWTSPLNLRWADVTTRLVEAFCAGGGRGVVVAGSCAEYDWSHGYCREDTTPREPATLYGAAKDAAGRLTMAVCRQHQVPCAWGRLFLLYGAGEADARLVPSLAATFSGRRAPFAINATAYRDLLHVTDVASALVTLSERMADGAFNVSSGQPVTLEEVARRLARQLDADPAPLLALATERPGDPALLVGDNRRLRSLDWRPALSLDQGLSRCTKEARTA